MKTAQCSRRRRLPIVLREGATGHREPEADANAKTQQDAHCPKYPKFIHQGDSPVRLMENISPVLRRYLARTRRFRRYSVAVQNSTGAEYGLNSAGVPAK